MTYADMQVAITSHLHRIRASGQTKGLPSPRADGPENVSPTTSMASARPIRGGEFPIYARVSYFEPHMMPGDDRILH